MKIAITGASGMIGAELVKYYLKKSHEVLPLAHEDIEITDQTSFESVREFKPDIIINCAGLDYDSCMGDTMWALHVNGVGAQNLALLAKEFDAEFLHFSTGHVYSGYKNQYVIEDEPTDPLTIHGISMLAGESLIKRAYEKHYIVRTASVYGIHEQRNSRTNLVLNIIDKGKKEEKLEMPTNLRICPTWTLQIAKQISYILGSGEYGTYHVSALGDCSYYDLALLIAEELRLPASIIPIKRNIGNYPENILLENKNLQVVRLDKMDWWDLALKRFLLNFEPV